MGCTQISNAIRSNPMQTASNLGLSASSRYNFKPYISLTPNKVQCAAETKETIRSLSSWNGVIPNKDNCDFSKPENTPADTSVTMENV